MKNTMTAQEAIDAVVNEKTTFLGVEVNKHNHPWEIRQELQVMAEKGSLSSIEFYKAMKITFAGMTEREKEIDKSIAEGLPK